MKAKVSLILAVLCLELVGTESTFAGRATTSCQDYLITTNNEQVVGHDVAVTRFTSKPEATNNPGVPVREAFGDDPQIIIGIDTSNSNRPYLVVGESLFRTTRSTERVETIWIYNAATKTSMPQPRTVTTYHLGELRAEYLPRGYFLRVSGLSTAQIEKLQSKFSSQVRAGSSNESWNHMIANLTEELSKHTDLRLACEDPECDYRYDLFKRAIQKGFSIPGGDQIIKTEFYTVDEGSLEDLVASAKRSKFVGVAGTVTLMGVMGLATGTALFVSYQLIAMLTGLPELPMPF